jgi:hypothetical protein
MSCRLLVSIVTVALLFGGQPRAQVDPDLTGTWVLEKSEGNGADIAPSTVVIVETPESVTVENRMGDETSRLTYIFKAPSPDVMPPERPGATKVGDATAKWVDNQLETFAILTINGKTVTQSSHWKLDATGSELTVVKDLMVHHGYESGQANSTATDVYRRKQ